MIICYIELIKLRILSLSLVTMTLGYILGRTGESFNFSLYLVSLIGVMLSSSAAASFNQLIEQKYDALMPRTKNRPLPSGRISSMHVFLFSSILLLLGSFILFKYVNFLTCLLCLFTVFIYDLIYTPLKRITPFNTFIGAIPGAMPVLCGWSSAMGYIPETAWIFFIILAFWQLPHFFSIAWMYKDSYKHAGFKMLSEDDDSGKKTAIYIIIYTFLLIIISLLPVLTGLVRWVYFCFILFSGSIFLYFSILFFKEATLFSAKKVLRASIIYPFFLFLGVVLDVLL
jgi:protoheme IX farnesyltransferase